MFCLRDKRVPTNVKLIHSFILHKNVVFPAHAGYSYFSADSRLKIFL